MTSVAVVGVASRARWGKAGGKVWYVQDLVLIEVSEVV